MILSRNIREVLCNWVVLIKSPTATEELQISLAVQIFPITSSCDAKSSSQRFENEMAAINAIIIGAGPSGIAMGHKMKHELGFEDFTIYEKLDGVGGTWRTNTYPGW